MDNIQLRINGYSNDFDKYLNNLGKMKEELVFNYEEKISLLNDDLNNKNKIIDDNKRQITALENKNKELTAQLSFIFVLISFIFSYTDSSKFELTVINPTFVMGPICHGSVGTSQEVILIFKIK